MNILNNMKYNIILLIIPVIFLLGGCTREPVLEPDVTLLPDDPDTQIRDFVWEGMNSWYLYQAEKDNLADTRDDVVQEYLEFLNSFSSPEALFDGLLYQPNIKDKFSFIVDDYDELANQLQGISEDFGFDYRLVRLSSSSNDLLGYIRYVLPDTPADEAGLKRGDLFTKIDGKQLTISNYQELLFNNPSYDLGLVEFNGSGFVPGKSIPLIAEVIHENPILVSRVYESQAGTKVGYLVLNGFNILYHHELNEVFGVFKNEGVKELILDLRYNPGGTVITAAMLASMIYTNDTNKNFITFDYNSKHDDLDQPMDFMDKVYLFDNNLDVTGSEPLNTLGVSRLFVLTSTGTASASEAVINGLDPYIDVVVIGEQTVGKNVGSRTIYDSPDSDYADKATANPVHKYALQPLTTKIINSIGFGEYEDGFTPDLELSELDYLVDLKPLGDLEEPLLNAALDYISPTRSDRRIPANFAGHWVIPEAERKSQNPFYRSLTLDFIEKIQ